MKRYEIENFPIDHDSLELGETLFHNANGYLGVRGCFEEGYPAGYNSVRGTYINGFYDFVSMPQAEKLYGLIEEKQTMLNAVDTQGIELYVEGERFSLFEGEVLSRKRSLDMEQGITKRELVWKSPSGKTVEIEIKRMASFQILPLFFVEYRVKAVDFFGELRIISTHNGAVMNYFDPTDPRVAGESCRHILPHPAEIEEDVSYIEAVTSKSGLKLCSAVKNRFLKVGRADKSQKQDVQAGVYGNIEGACAQESCMAGLKAGESFVLYKYTILCDSIRYQNVRKNAVSWMKTALNMGVDELYQAQELYLQKFWENCALEVEGDEDLNEAVSYNLYQLIQSAGKDPYCNIAAKGLSGEGYEGHYFWDTEMYLQPFFILNARDISKNLIKNRYLMLDDAKENAKLLGHKKGAAYPWRTIMGKECSGYFPSGSAQYHISGDISYAVVFYYLATKDLELMKECGAEILVETARMWMELGNWHKGKFQINTVTGPDEYTCLVNNNYYTNVLAQYNLLWAGKMVALLKEAGMEQALMDKALVTENELREWKAAQEQMYLPYDKEMGINPQDDSFLQKEVWDPASITEAEKPLLLHYHPMYLYRFQICKQADTVLAHFILEDAQEADTIRSSFAYYEKVTTHDSSLSTCIYSIVAAKLGLVEKAYTYFGESAKMDLFNTHKNTKDGIHTANMGGTYMAIVYGFGGLRIKESGLSLNPVLPGQWKGFRFRFLYEDARIEVSVKKGICIIRLLEGSPRKISVAGTQYLLENELEVRL